MINRQEMAETIHMIDREHLDIRILNNALNIVAEGESDGVGLTPIVGNLLDDTRHHAVHQFGGSFHDGGITHRYAGMRQSPRSYRRPASSW